jgi:hypothetical protein
MKMSVKKKIAWVIVFAIAMGILEGVVVVYLRELFYPSGFSFPLVRIPDRIALAEILREATTVIMLIAIGVLAGTSGTQRFSFFLLAFGTWDIVYYILLYAAVGWPSSPGDWDILFLIPFPWVGPVWAPCLLSALMIAGSLRVIRLLENNPQRRPARMHWTAAIGGAAICLGAFLQDYLVFAHRTHGLHKLLSDEALEGFSHYVPTSFNTILFLCGFILMTASLLHFIIQSKRHEN